jgi:hypothetical protein
MFTNYYFYSCFIYLLFNGLEVKALHAEQANAAVLPKVLDFGMYHFDCSTLYRVS